MANVIINNETLTGIDTVRLKNADNPSTYVEFKEGGAALPTLNAPSLTSGGASSVGYVSTHDNGTFVDYFDIYDYFENLLVSLPASGHQTSGYGYRYYMNAETWNLSLGSNTLKAKVRCANFNDSNFSNRITSKCCSITENFSHITATTNRTKFANENFTISIEADSGYVLPSSITIVNGSYTATCNNGVITALTSQYGTSSGFTCTYSQTEGTLTFENGAGIDNMTIAATATEIPSGHSVTISPSTVYINDRQGNITITCSSPFIVIPSLYGTFAGGGGGWNDESDWDARTFTIPDGATLTFTDSIGFTYNGTQYTTKTVEVTSDMTINIGVSEET